MVAVYDKVPTMAIETIHMHENTSILHDEVLAHRLGLVPIMADPNEFDDLPPGADPTENNTIVFKLDQVFRPSKQVDRLLPHDTVSPLRGMTVDLFLDSHSDS